MTSMEAQWAIRPEVWLIHCCNGTEKVQMNYPGRSMPSRFLTRELTFLASRYGMMTMGSGPIFGSRDSVDAAQNRAVMQQGMGMGSGTCCLGCGDL